MGMPDKTLFRDGKAILKVHENPDGSVILYKPFVVKRQHTMEMTGTPGWDKQAVDTVFDNFVTGWLTYTSEDNVRHRIRIEDFRGHAFVKEVGTFGEQYHCAKAHWENDGPAPKVSPIRTQEPTGPVAFGEYVNCSKCRGDKRKAKGCEVCGGKGIVRWTGSSGM